MQEVVSLDANIKHYPTCHDITAHTCLCHCLQPIYCSGSIHGLGKSNNHCTETMYIRLHPFFNHLLEPVLGPLAVFNLHICTNHLVVVKYVWISLRALPPPSSTSPLEPCCWPRHTCESYVHTWLHLARVHAPKLRQATLLRLSNLHDVHSLG